jgi:hypothetical protein
MKKMFLILPETMPILNSDNFDHHFWEADSYHDGAFNDGLFITKASAWTVSEDLWAFAKDQYKQGNKDRAYYYLGRVVHLLEDMGCPPHVHNDPHPSYAPYEYTMGKVFVNGEIKNRDEYPKGRSIYLTWHTDALKKVLITDETSISALEIRNNPSNYLSDDMPLVIQSFEALKSTDPQSNSAFKEYKDLLEAEAVSNIEENWSNQTDLFRIFYSMNELSDDFPSGDYDGDIIKNHDDDDSDMKDYNSYHYYAPVIQPAIIEHLAGLYLLFWKETHAFVRDTVKNDQDQPVENALVELFEEDSPTPKDTARTDANGQFSFYDIESEVNHTIKVSKNSHVTFISDPFQVTIGETTENIHPVITAIRPVVTSLSDIETPVHHAQWSWDADQPATFRYAIDQNSEWVATGDFTNNQTASISDQEGVWYLHVQAKNADGIVSEIVTVSAQLDQTAPEDVSLSVMPSQMSNDNTAVFEIQSQDVALYKYQIDMQPISSEYTTDIPISLNELSDGIHSIIITTADIAGNWQSEENALTYTWTVDTILPTISGLEDDTEASQSKQWQWTASEDCSFRFAVDQNEAWTPEGDFEDTTHLSIDGENGIWFLHVQAKDAAGNLSEIITVSAILDNQPPDKAELLNAPNNIEYVDTFSIEVFGEDITHYKYQFDQMPFSEETRISDSIQLTDLDEGTHSLVVIARDMAGNWQSEHNAATSFWQIILVDHGDINNDDHIDIKDAILACKILAGIPLDSEIYILAEVNNNQQIDIADLIFILQKIALCE